MHWPQVLDRLWISVSHSHFYLGKIFLLIYRIIKDLNLKIPPQLFFVFCFQMFVCLLTDVFMKISCIISCTLFILMFLLITLLSLWVLFFDSVINVHEEFQSIWPSHILLLSLLKFFSPVSTYFSPHNFSTLYQTLPWCKEGTINVFLYLS